MLKNKKSKDRSNYYLKIFIFLTGLVSAFYISSEANAASLYFSPSSGSYNTGQYVSTGVFVGPSETINAMGGVISFPKDIIEITSISRSGSIIDFWVQDPYFSNTTGKLEFEGAIFNPGFSGSVGRIITINFRAKRSGTAGFNFLSGSVLAHDGMGTEVLKTLGSASFSFSTSLAVNLPTIGESIDFEIKVDNEGDTTNPAPILIIEPKEILPKIEYFEIKIGENEIFRVDSKEFEDDDYRLPAQLPGKYIIEVKGVDKDENFNIVKTDINIESLRAPVITYFPLTIKTDDYLLIKGTSHYPDANILIYIRKGGKREILDDIKTDSSGEWIYFSDKNLEQGVYEIRAQVVDNRGARSDLGQKIMLNVVLPAFLKIGNIQMDKLTTIITIISILIIIILKFAIITYYSIFSFKRKTRIKAKNNKAKIKRIFSILKEEIDERVGKGYEKERTKDRLKEALNISENYIEEEITEFNEKDK